MFRAAVTLLVSLQLLMPQGMCICQFVPTGTTPAPRPAGTTHVADAGQHCACATCQTGEHPPADGKHRDCGDPGRPCEGEPSAPAPGKHWPGCPAAALGAMPTKMAVAPAAVPLDAGPVLSFTLPPVEPRVLARGADSLPRPAVSPPLYLSHCAFLI